MPPRKLNLPVRTLDAWTALLERKAQETRVISSVDAFLERSLSQIQKAFAQGVSYDEMVADLHELGYKEISVDDLRAWIARATSRRDRVNAGRSASAPTGAAQSGGAAQNGGQGAGKNGTSRVNPPLNGARNGAAATGAAGNGGKGATAPAGGGSASTTTGQKSLGTLDVQTVDQTDANAVGAAIGAKT